MSETAALGRHGRIHPSFGPPVRLEKRGHVWIVFGPGALNCWEGPRGLTLFSDRTVAVETLAALGFVADDRGVVTPAVAP